ncbi:MAG TPA: MMPL family transporter, partial [Solirubrobacteraceae bacterium]|nr:MMPL family transporter [Solirubrobacteraceae bacterium]
LAALDGGALSGWLALAIVLSIIGLGGASSISPQVTVTHGTESYRATQLAEQKFGPTQLLPILLEGPKAQLDRAGPNLVRALVERPHTRALSAWDAGSAAPTLRPSPTAAMIVVAVDRSEAQTVKTDLPQIRALIAQTVGSPLHAYVSGQATIDQAMKDSSVSSLRQAALWAIPLLFLLLVIGLRAPLGAALVTLAAGGATLSALGLMALLGKVLTVDAIALATGGIAGLTSGASFALAILDRFRHEEADHPNAVRAAVASAVGGTGRALLFAGTLVIAALLAADVLGPTDVLASLGIGAVLCTAFATGAALVVVPAALVLFGPVITDWRAPAPARLSRGWNRLVGFGDAVVRHPAAFGSLAALVLLALAVPIVNVKTGPQDPRLLPSGSQARVAYYEIARVMGPGYPAPYDVVVSNPNGPITTPAMIAKLNSFELLLARDPAVASVTGPGAINANAQQLSTFGPQLAKSTKLSKQSKTDLLTLINGLGQAGSGSAQLQAGLRQASQGATQLHSGSGQAQTGAGQLHTGLVQARSGSAQLQAGLDQALAGAKALKTGAAQALAGSAQLTAGLEQAAGPVKSGLPTVSQLAGDSMAVLNAVNGAKSALQSMSTGTSDPHYQAALNALTQASKDGSAAAFIASGLYAQLKTQLAPGLDQLRNGAAQLQAGIQQLRDGNAQLAGGLGQLSGGGHQLTTGLDQLTAGAAALQTGLGQLADGTGQLASGLAGGVSPAGQLVAGLGQMQAAVIKSRGQIPSTADLEKLMRESPGIFSSGYFVLAALEGAQPNNRNAVTFTLNLLRGGDTGQILVTGRYPLSDPRSQRLGDRLRALAASFSRTSHLNIAIGGTAGSLFDVARTASDKLPATLIGVALTVALLLGLMLRSIMIPVLATLTAGLTTLGAFGLEQLLFGGHDPVLGGPGSFDPVSEIEIIVAIFTATLLYVALLVARAREYYVADGGVRESLRRAMRATIASTSGMAAITIGVLVPFAASDLQPLRRIAVAGGLAVALVAYVIVPVMLPAAITLFRRVGWWPTHGPHAAGGPPSRPSRRLSFHPLPGASR